MAITGTGTQADPYIITTYAELVSKADEQGAYITVGNDINITSEYPDGNMPTLEIDSTHIDGNNKTISNWYKNTSGYCIEWTNSNDATSDIKNLILGNIIPSSNVTAFCKTVSHTVPVFENCGFYGDLNSIFKEGETALVKDCSFNFNLKKQVTQGESTFYDFNGIIFENCYVILKDTTAVAQRHLFSNFYTNPFAKNSYFEVETTAASMTQYKQGQGAENSVFDIQASASWEWGNAEGYSCSIFNSTSAPNLTGSNNVKAVDDTHWLDVAYLSSIGFNAG